MKMMKLARLFRPTALQLAEPVAALQADQPATWHIDPPCCCSCDDGCPFLVHRANEPRMCIRACQPCWDSQKPLYS